MRIIAVDDERLALDALVSAIRKAEPGAQLYAFSDADEAVEFLASTPCDVAFLDIEMPETDGIELTQALRRHCPNINIIFSTGYGEYRQAAFDLHASGYLTKPILPEDVRKELDDLRRPVMEESTKRVRVQAFGNFEVFLDGTPMHFKYDRTREVMAYLVNQAGSFCTTGELMEVLFEEEPGHDSYLQKLRRDLLDSFEAAGCGGVIIQQRGKLAVNPEEIQCDYYDWRAGKREALNLYQGKYMAQYSWAEFLQNTLQN